MARSRPGQWRVSGLALQHLRSYRVGGHDGFPLWPLGVAHFDGDGAAHGQPVPDPTNDPYVVLLERHTGTTSVSQPASSQILLDAFGGGGDAGRKTFNDAHERWPVRLTSCQPPKHPVSVSDQTCESVAGPLG